MYKAKCSCGWNKECGIGEDGHVKAIVSAIKHEERSKRKEHIVNVIICRNK